jgi:two-component system alkaline phosphatase synthesis response regulator PhoP
MAKLITIVDDEPDILELVSLNLKKAGFQTKEFTSVKSFYKYIETNLPDLVILDLMLPETDGLEVCKQLKNQERTKAIPVIMLTARSEETDKVLGLELGADDYITKPFSPKELTARVKAVLRRGSTQLETKKVQIGKHILLDSEKFEV